MQRSSLSTQPDSLIPEQSQGAQAWDRYAYVNNNPVRYNDPTGHCPWCIAIGVGALIGAGVTYGFQVAANISQNGLTVQAFTDVNWAAVGGGAVAGAVGVATFGLGTAVMGTGLGATVAAGAISGAISGQAARATENVLSGQEVTAGLGNPVDMAADAVIGGALAGVGYGMDRLARPAVAEAARLDPNAIGRWGEQLVGEQLPVEVRPFPVANSQRVYDGRFIGTDDLYVEVKTSTRGVIYLNQRIREQIAFDASMTPKPIWILVNARPSRGLLNLFREGGIPWHEIHIPR